MWVDEFLVWNTSKSSDEVKQLYNDYVLGTAFTETPSTNTFTINIQDKYNSTPLNAEITLYNSTYSNTSTAVGGTFTFNDVNGLMDINLTLSEYYSLHFEDWNVSNELTANMTFYKAIFEQYEKLKDDFNESIILNATFSFYHTNGTLALETNTETGNLTALLDWNNSYNCMIDPNSYYPENISFDTYSNYEVNESINFTLSKARFILNQKLIDELYDEVITNFTLNFYYSINDTLATSKSSINGNLTTFLDWDNNYYAIIDSLGYELKNITFNTSNNYIQSENINLYSQNSVRIFVRDEDTGNLITQTVNIQFSTNDSLTNYQTSNGTLFVFNLTPNSYSVKFNSTDYTIRTYSIVISNRSSQELNAYLTTAESSTIFTIKDESSLDTISDVLLTMYRFINDTWQPVESKYSDVTGRVQVTYDPDTHYKFYLAKSGYQDYIFYLNPILFSEYNIQIKKITDINASQDYDHLSIKFNKTFKTGSNNFSFIIQNPYGELISYGYTLTYPSSSTSNSGSNVLGSELTSSFNIVNATVFDTVKIEYYYISSIVGLRNFTEYYPIQYTDTNRSMANPNSDPTFGLGLLERSLVVVIIGILIMGLAVLINKPYGGAVLTFFVWSYLVYSKFISIWFVIVSIVIGVLLISLRGER